ncbi:MAG TPA: hypothetical protein VN645_11195 [Steroidobacteraceae bacterium]|nr:hypothetical protein [Steroidobacteraceae bacterium]
MTRFGGFLACVLLSALALRATALEPGARPPAPSLTPASGSTRVDARGFIRRWLVLEPITVSGPLTESAVEAALKASALAGSPETMPRDGEVVQPGNLRWHALDTKGYNFNLYHFAWALSKPTSNVLFWIVTTVDVPQETKDVRLAIGSNAASHWWLNGESVITIYGDRQTVIDDGVSRRVTLHKGRNVIRAAIVNGGGATDFCARFLDANNRPITTLSVSLQSQADSAH